jgi:hypothetical protein
MDKCKTINTVDFESAVRELERDIRETEHLTKTYVLKRIDDLKNTIVTYGTPDPFVIPTFLKKLP